MAAKVARIPNRRRRAQVIATSAQPKALYGCESSATPEEPLRLYRAATLRALDGPHHMGRSPAMAFTVCDGAGTDLDPEVDIFGRRAAVLRRYWYKAPGQRDKVLGMMRAYVDCGYVGTDCSALHLLRPVRAQELGP